LAPTQTRDVSRFPRVEEAKSRVKIGGYAEEIIRMMILMARARGCSIRSRPLPP
jgi:hypothetical protein